MKEIILTRGYKALVDDDDFEELSKYKWQARLSRNGVVYAVRTDCRGQQRRNVIMHRLILGVTNPKQLVDHIDHNGLNNCKSNLRIASSRQNASNKRSAKGSSSKYLGVHLHRTKNRYGYQYESWSARIKMDGKYKRLGLFKTEEAAAKAYNEAAIKVHGKFANLNKVESAEVH